MTDWTDEQYTVYQLLVYAEALKTNLTVDELKVISKLVVQLKEE